MPRIAGNHQRRGAAAPCEVPEGTKVADPLILDFWPPELCKNKFLLFEAIQFLVICYGSSRKFQSGRQRGEVAYLLAKQDQRPGFWL